MTVDYEEGRRLWKELSEGPPLYRDPREWHRWCERNAEALLNPDPWRPISEAPKDGTEVLGFIDGKGENFNEMVVMFCKKIYDDGPFWTMHADDHVALEPTYWAPLPLYPTHFRELKGPGQ